MCSRIRTDRVLTIGSNLKLLSAGFEPIVARWAGHARFETLRRIWSPYSVTMLPQVTEYWEPNTVELRLPRGSVYTEDQGLWFSLETPGCMLFIVLGQPKNTHFKGEALCITRPAASDTEANVHPRHPIVLNQNSVLDYPNRWLGVIEQFQGDPVATMHASLF